jgi:hypothetical protein
LPTLLNSLTGLTPSWCCMNMCISFAVILSISSKFCPDIQPFQLLLWGF